MWRGLGRRQQKIVKVPLSRPSSREGGQRWECGGCTLAAQATQHDRNSGEHARTLGRVKRREGVPEVQPHKEMMHRLHSILAFARAGQLRAPHAFLAKHR